MKSTLKGGLVVKTKIYFFLSLLWVQFLSLRYSRCDRPTPKVRPHLLFSLSFIKRLLFSRPIFSITKQKGSERAWSHRLVRFTQGFLFSIDKPIPNPNIGSGNLLFVSSIVDFNRLIFRVFFYFFIFLFFFVDYQF